MGRTTGLLLATTAVAGLLTGGAVLSDEQPHKCAVGWWCGETSALDDEAPETQARMQSIEGDYVIRYAPDEGIVEAWTTYPGALPEAYAEVRVSDGQGVPITERLDPHAGDILDLGPELAAEIDSGIAVLSIRTCIQEYHCSEWATAGGSGTR